MQELVNNEPGHSRINNETLERIRKNYSPAPSIRVQRTASAKRNYYQPHNENQLEPLVETSAQSLCDASDENIEAESQEFKAETEAENPEAETEAETEAENPEAKPRERRGNSKILRYNLIGNRSPDQMALKCLGCSFSTHDEKAMRNHEIGAHGAKIPSKCSGCNFSTDDQQAMKEHEIRSHGPNSKKFRLNCSHQNCETTTTDPKAMIEHEKRAHGVKPGQKRKHSIQSVIKCDLCTFYTEEQRFMDMHKAGAHGNKRLPDYEKILGIVPKTILPATLKCTDCTFMTQDKQLMMTHRNNLHEKCSECNFTSKFKKIMQIHRKNAHEISSIAESPKEIVLLMNPDNLLAIKKEPLEPNEDPFANLPDPLEINEPIEDDNVTSKETFGATKTKNEILEKQKSTHEEWKMKKQIYSNQMEIEKDELTSKETFNAPKIKAEILEKQKSTYEEWKMEKQIYSNSNRKMLQAPTNKRKLDENIETVTHILNFKHTKEQTFGKNAEIETTSLSPPSERSK